MLVQEVLTYGTEDSPPNLAEHVPPLIIKAISKAMPIWVEQNLSAQKPGKGRVKVHIRHFLKASRLTPLNQPQMPLVACLEIRDSRL